MPRVKSVSDKQVLDLAIAVLHERGPAALTFASLSVATGLSPATLVQRFRNMTDLKQATLLHAWDGLREKTAALAAAAPRTPEGALGILLGLSTGYGPIETYAEGLLILREDLRDPVLRARGAEWKQQLSTALDACLARSAAAGAGLAMASQWQGSLLWWGFDGDGPAEEFVERELRSFLRLAGVP